LLDTATEHTLSQQAQGDILSTACPEITVIPAAGLRAEMILALCLSVHPFILSMWCLTWALMCQQKAPQLSEQVYLMWG